MNLKKLPFEQLVAIVNGMPAPKAISTYKSWVLLNPKHGQVPLAHFQMGAHYAAIRDWQRAEAAFTLVTKRLPKFALAWQYLGVAIDRTRGIRQRVEYWNHLVSRIESGDIDRTNYIDALKCQALALEAGSEWVHAADSLEKIFKLDSSQNDVLYHLIRMRQRLCDWPILRDMDGVSYERLLNHISAIAMLSVTDDPATQLASSVRYSKKNISKSADPWRTQRKGPKDKLRIGYASSNFGMHAVTFLISDAIESHPRDRFEVFGYCWSPAQSDVYRDRIVNAFDHFVPVREMTDEQVAQRIRADGIDILIDLQGLTAGARPEIYGQRPAPIQISYLGHPGSNAVPGVDYLIADEVLVGLNEEQHYVEKIIRLESCFQVNDRRRRVFTRENKTDFGFSADTCLLLAHNNTNKITEEMFSAWCAILQATDKATLWVIADNQRAHENLKREFDARGIPGYRYRIDRNADYETYMRRLGVGDLMLDTFPFNGGTTTSDALWMGLPVLTLKGRSFASRMSASLLGDFELHELVSNKLEEYVDKAVCLARQKGAPREIFGDRLTNKKSIYRYGCRIKDYNRRLESF